MDTQIKTFSLESLNDLVIGLGIPKFRAMQIAEWIYKKGANSYSEMTNLPKTMRNQLEDAYPLYRPIVVDKEISRDGSRKYLLQFNDGVYAETVAMPHEDGRLSVCISSQAGCAMGCAFCATGKNGLARNLIPGELVDQILVVQDDFEERISNVVVMGQGEPFANYQSTLAALRIINHPKLLNIGSRHITVSTCGIISGIQKLSEEPEQFTLAVSLHSALQTTRNNLMPGVRNQSLPELKQALIAYNEKTGRRFSFEYALMKDLNDSKEALAALIAYCDGLLCHVNLIPLNPIDDSPFKPVSQSAMNYWKQGLENAGVPCSVRNSRGSDISGACGQLAAKIKR